MAGTHRVFERDRPFVVRHLALDLALDVPHRSVKGVARLRMERVDAAAEEVVLDAVGFELSAVEWEGEPVSYVYDGERIRFKAPNGAAGGEVRVVYSATPRRGLYFLEPDEHVRSRPRQVWTQCQEEDGRHWFPCHDAPHVKMTTELAVDVPNGWHALSNGELVSKETDAAAATWRFHYRLGEPQPSYLMTLVAGEFAVLEEQAGSVPLAYWVPKGREEDARRTFQATSKMMEIFGKVFGVAYPYRRYSQVVVSDFIFGGMENTTATTLYEHVLLDRRAALDITSDDLIAHELAHQWFGNYVTCRDWSEGWLNEGFATYAEHVFREHTAGRDEDDWYLKADLESYLSEAHGRYRRPVVCQEYDAPLDLFDRHLYEKGGLVLHMLRLELGDDAFFAGVRRYLERHAHGIVETRDLLRALEEVSGRSLGRFFDQWLYKPGHPELDVTLAWDKEGVLSIDVKQTQSATDGVPSAFEVPLILEVHGADGERTSVRRVLSQRTEHFAVPCSRRPKFVVVDPQMRIVGEVKVKAPWDMLRAQLEGAPTARGRWLAASALAGSEEPASLKALAARLEDENEFWGVRAECAEALGRRRLPEAFVVLARNTGTKHPKVRRAVVAALGRFRSTSAVEAIKPRALLDESYLVEAEACRSLGKTRQSAAFDVLVEVMDRSSWAEVIRTGAADGLAALRDERALPLLMPRTRYGHPDRARRAAIAALPKLSSDRRTREAIEDLLDDRNPIVRLDVVVALADLGDARSRAALRSRLEAELDPRVRRRIREVLRDLGGESKGAVRELKDELDKLQTEQGELKARLARLEALLGEPAKQPAAAEPPKAPAEAPAPSKKRKKGKGPSRGSGRTGTSSTSRRNHDNLLPGKEKGRLR